jgi:RNA polymerase-interacting CarD/CdnL/TRCF family regulator
MTFRPDELVVFPAFGLGRVAGIVTRCLDGPEAVACYEVAGEHSTLWVEVSEAAARGLRRLARQDELPGYRAVLRAAPFELSANARHRYRDAQDRIKRGTLQDLCELVRDLSARGRQQALGEYDRVALTKSRRLLCQEWAAAKGVSVTEAGTEVNGLLRQGQLACGG